MSSYTLYQRGEVWWCDISLAGKRHRASCKTRSRRSAEKHAAEVLRDMERGVEAITLRDAMDLCMRVRWAGTKGERTAHINATTAIDHYGGGTLLRTIGTPEVDQYVQTLQDAGLSGGTVNRKLAALSAVLRVAWQRGLIDAVPHIPRQKEAQGRIRWLTDAEESALLEAIRLDEDHHRMTVAMLDTGMRLGEAMRFTERDLSPDGTMVHIWVAKSGKPRSIPLTARAQEVMRAGSFHLDKMQYYRVWRSVKQAMGLQDDAQFVPHALRHTCASRLVQRGVPLAVIQAWLGHSDIKTTMRYAHIAPANLDAARAALEA